MAIVEMTEENLQEIAGVDGILVLTFWTPACEPSQAFAPALEAAAARHPDIRFARVNADEQPLLAGMFEVTATPTVLIFRDQLLVYATRGVVNAAGLEETLEKTQKVDMARVRDRISQELLTIEKDPEDDAPLHGPLH